MFKSASSNHSLWPEQARPRKTKQQLALVIGAACIGAVAAISAHNVLTELSTPAQEPVQQSSLAAPIFATPSPASAESAVAASASLAAAKLLSASTAPAIPSSATDGRGGATAARSGETLATGAAIAATASAPVKATEVAKSADSAEAGLGVAKIGAARLLCCTGS